MNDLLGLVTQPENLMAIAVVVGVMATVITVILPLFGGDNLDSRMKSVALEREQIRARERAKMAADKSDRQKVARKEPGAVVKSIVEKLNLRQALADEQTTLSLVQAGYRGQSPLFLFLTARFVLPLIFMAGAAVYLFFISENELSFGMRIMAAAMFGGLGFYLPIFFINKVKSARQLSITKAWPDALDLCLICVESGMTIESAFRKVAAEIGAQSMPLAEELLLTTAELSYLPDRRTAFNNLTERTGLDAVKNVVLSLGQAEKYGTPLSQALRVLSRENRDDRMNKAEKKAAALPPKLTVPMMVCFMPVLFCVILGPAMIQAMAAFE